MSTLFTILGILAALLGILWIAGHPEYFEHYAPPRRRRDD
jgi:hypothetical protein